MHIGKAVFTCSQLVQGVLRLGMLCFSCYNKWFAFDCVTEARNCLEMEHLHQCLLPFCLFKCVYGALAAAVWWWL